jgi:Cdc6-like AAA superfamily ATPase
MLSLESESLGSLPEDVNVAEPRSHHMKLLRSWLLPVPCPCSVWVWGGIGTGKTHVLRALMHEASFVGRVAFVDCATAITANRSPKTLFEGILNQLCGHDVGNSAHFASKWSCPNSFTFLVHLEELCHDVPCYIVLDNADALVDGVDAQVFSFLVEMSQDTSGPVGVVFVARKDWRLCARGFSLGAHPMQVHFEPWSEEESNVVLRRMAAATEKPSAFRVAHRGARSRWTARLVQTLQMSAAPLFGMHNLHNMELDGFKVVFFDVFSVLLKIIFENRSIKVL